MSDNGETRKKITAFDLATIIAGWSTALALALGFITFTITYRAQEKFNQAQLKFNEQQQKFNDAQLDATNKQASFLAETAAIEAFRAYFAAGIEAAKPADRNQWLTNDAFFTAETIYNLKSTDNGWRETAKGLILNRRSVIDTGQFDCDKYAPAFVKFVQDEVVMKDPCRKTKSHPNSIQTSRSR